MQENVIGTEPLAEITVGRESEEMCLLAKFFNGFANSTRLSILLLLTQRGEMKVGERGQRAGGSQPRVSDHLRCSGLVRLRAGTARGPQRGLPPSRTSGSSRSSSWARRC